MSGNPLEDNPERDHRIRDRAYHLWVDEGRPHGRHAEFWERARELIGMEDSAGFGQLPNPQGAGLDPAAEQPVEEAFLQENLGEFPGRFADQGETEPTPRARHAGGAKAEAPEPVARQSAKTGAKSKAKPSEPAPETLPANPSLKAKAVKAAKGTKAKR